MIEFADFQKVEMKVAKVVGVEVHPNADKLYVVNRFGSFFYGSILGVFVLAMFVPRATSLGAFVGLIAGIASVAAVATWLPWIAFLWHNVVGVVAVVVVGFVVSVIAGGQPRR